MPRKRQPKVKFTFSFKTGSSTRTVVVRRPEVEFNAACCDAAMAFDPRFSNDVLEAHVTWRSLGDRRSADVTMSPTWVRNW